MTPRASTPIPSRKATIAVGVAPIRVFPFDSNVIVAKTGRSEFSLAARTAAFISYKSLIVSIRIASTLSPAQLTCSLKISYASSNDRVPVGSMSWPIGPISRNKKQSFSIFSLRHLSFSRKIAARALFIAAVIISMSEYGLSATRQRFDPNVFVRIQDEPLARYSLWISVTISGCVKLYTSGSSPGSRPLACSWEPIPPSKISGVCPSFVRRSSFAFTGISISFPFKGGLILSDNILCCSSYIRNHHI